MKSLATWPPKVVHGVTADLFPSVLTLDELIEIGRTVPEPKSTTGGFGYAIGSPTSSGTRVTPMRLDQARNSAYVVTREDEVADKKKTDIRLSATRCSERAVIEIKILDKRWSVADLKYSLEHQVLGQYLRHANTRAGCFLLTYNGDRLSWRDARSGPSYTFDSLVKMLQAEAAALELREGGQVRIALIGLALRDPSLVPAQRRRSPHKNADTNPGGK